ncbi:hypothetical protein YASMINEVIRUS_1564 [Yasminevirus sp. GU-2018]|uniref:Uncharacterized protein n=1 Tax=Yasminevirus sp. GU-2018 TaxID=2420051 RepID=A0A5K0UBI3_9VIRU|nr:hypothetical protein YASMINEVIRUS_1564 [Yasminevirus sp. GU-2018]
MNSDRQTISADRGGRDSRHESKHDPKQTTPNTSTQSRSIQTGIPHSQSGSALNLSNLTGKKPSLDAPPALSSGINSTRAKDDSVWGETVVRQEPKSATVQSSSQVPSQGLSQGLSQGSVNRPTHRSSNSVSDDLALRGIDRSEFESQRDGDRSFGKLFDRVTEKDASSKGTEKYLDLSFPKIPITRSGSESTRDSAKRTTPTVNKSGASTPGNLNQNPQANTQTNSVNIVDDPLDCMNVLLNTYDFQTVQHTLQTCQIVCSQLLELQQALQVLKYSVMTDEYDDSIELAKRCAEQLKLLTPKKGYGLVKILNEKHQEVMNKIKQRLIDNFSLANSGKQEDQTDRIVKLLELLGEDETNRFLFDVAKKMCSTVPKEPFSKSYDQSIKWIIQFLREDASYTSLIKYGIKSYLISCWADVVKETIKSDDCSLITRNMFLTFKKAYIDITKEYAQKGPNQPSGSPTLGSKRLNVLEFLDPVCERTINELITKATPTFDALTKVEKIEALPENTDNLFIAVKDFEKTVANFKNPRNEKMVIKLYVQIYERYIVDIKNFINRTNSYRASELNIVKEVLMKIFTLIREMETSYKTCILTTSMSFLAEVRNEPKADAKPNAKPDAKPDAKSDTKSDTKSDPKPQVRVEVSPARFDTTIENIIEDTVKALNKDIHEKYRSWIVEALEGTMARHKADGTINSVIKKGMNLLTIDRSSEKDRNNTSFTLTLDVSEQITKVTGLLNEIGTYDDNIKTYLVTDVLIWYKELIDINNLHQIRQSAFRQVIMDVYQIRTSTKIQGSIFAEVEGRAKFLSGDIIKDELFVEMFNTFYPVSQVEKLRTLAKYKGCSDEKTNNLIKIFRTIGQKNQQGASIPSSGSMSSMTSSIASSTVSSTASSTNTSSTCRGPSIDKNRQQRD